MLFAESRSDSAVEDEEEQRIDAEYRNMKDKQKFIKSNLNTKFNYACLGFDDEAEKEGAGTFNPNFKFVDLERMRPNALDLMTFHKVQAMCNISELKPEENIYFRRQVCLFKE